MVLIVVPSHGIRIIPSRILTLILAVRSGDIEKLAEPTLRLNTLPCRAIGKTQNRGIMALVEINFESVIIFFILLKELMRRHGNLWQEITSIKNICIAYEKAIRGKSKLVGVIKFKKAVRKNLLLIRESLLNKTFTTSKYHEKIVYEPKKRTIYVLPFSPDRIVQHALMNVIIPIWDKLFIDASYSCRTGKGIHIASNKTMEYVRRNKYVLKCDISKFYPSVDHEILFKIIQKKIKCKDTLWLLKNIIDSFPGGKNIPIGNYTSQWFRNLYLNELDYYLKDKCGVKDYVRYCDDFCIFANDKVYLHRVAKRINKFINEKLLLKFSKCEIFPIKQGVDFLGYRHFNNYVLLRKSTTKRVKSRLEKLPQLYKDGKINKDQFRSSVMSTWGWLKHANTHNLLIALKYQRLKRMVQNL